MTWNITDITTTSLSIKMVFTDPLYVSVSEADKVVVTFADTDLFITEQGIRIKPENRILRRNLMR